MLCDEVDRGIVILGRTNDSHVRVSQQGPGNAVAHKKGVLSNNY